MIHRDVTYIKSKPYRYEYTHREMIRQFLQTKLAKFLLQYYNNPELFSERFALELSRSNHYPKPITQNELDVEVRFDIVAIIKNKLGTRIEHLEDAFLFF